MIFKPLRVNPNTLLTLFDIVGFDKLLTPWWSSDEI
jgi:hypothetical protein